MNRLLVAWALCIGLLGAGENGYAHEMGTSALIVHESASGTGQFVFKRTVGSDDKIPPIDFQFAPVCELRDVSTEWEGNTELIQRGNFFCSKSLFEWSRMVFRPRKPKKNMYYTPRKALLGHFSPQN